MPRPHYPSQGGPHRAAWNPSEARQSRRATGFSSRPGHTAPSRLSDSAETSASQVSGAGGMNTASSSERGPEQSPFPLAAGLDSPFAAVFQNNRAVAWCAAFLCLTAAIFAIAAILGHG